MVRQVSQTYLLVEDDKLLASVLETALSDQVFELVVAKSSSAACKELDDHSADFETVNLDEYHVMSESLANPLTC